jgi:uncharacterized surface protein with fasciclin (FAS1) repeats
MRKVLLAAVAAVALSVGGFTSAALAQDAPGTIVDVAKSNADLSTLVTAVTAAELGETLSGPGPFTVFAPTNAAFEALPAGTLDSLLKDPKGALADILKLHVLSGAVDSKAAIAAAGGTVDSLGGPISVELDGDKLIVGGATVITADVKASNGVIHLIDAVITKPATEAPTEVATGDDGLAATSSSNTLLLVLGGMALVGVASSSLVIARNRRRG